MDMRKPIMWQILDLTKEEYDAWVHVPFHYKEEPKYATFFHTSAIEPLSKTLWWVVPLVWVPIACYNAAPALVMAAAGELQWLRAFVLFAAGVMLWSTIEYSLHRWVFHLDESLPDNRWLRLAHFLLHGVHHKIPMDRYRLVMPPVMAAAIAFPVYNLLKFIIMGGGIITKLPEFNLMWTGGLVGYMLYDMLHYAEHHARLEQVPFIGEHLAFMKKYHMKHHYGEQGSHQLGYGITSTVWDNVFNTRLNVQASKKAA